MADTKNKVVVIGGGTGSFVILSGLKGKVHDLTALVNMADDGGSTGSLRDDLGVLPPGDVRQCLIALSNAPQEVRELFAYRFEEGSLAGHSFGNLFLSAVQKMTNNFADAVRMAGDVLDIQGHVIPITLDDVHLSLELHAKTTLHGQHKIDDSHFQTGTLRPELRLSPSARIAPAADNALRDANLIVIAPGDIYTSLGPLLIVDGVAEALQTSHAKIVYISNLVVKPGHTNGFTVADHAAEIERFAGGPILDIVFYNTSMPDKAMFAKYARKDEHMIQSDPTQFAHAHYKAIGADLLAAGIAIPPAGDPLAENRSFIRHNGNAVARRLLALL